MAAEALRVGLPVSQSGEFSLQGEQVLAGVERWVQWTNDRGGLGVADGRRVPVELVRYDDGSDPAVAADLTERLIRDDGVDLLFGPYSSRLTLAAAPVADDRDVVLWNHSGATDALYDGGFEWLVGVLSPASRYFHGLLDMLDRLESSAPSVAVCWSRGGSFGPAVAAGARDRAGELGFPIVDEQPWESPLSEATPIVDSLRDSDTDVVLGAGSFGDDVALVDALAARDLRPKATGVVAAGISAFGERLGETAAGVFGPSQWEARPGLAPDHGPSSREVLDLFEAAGLGATDYPAAQAFATGVVLEGCLAGSGAYDPATGTIDQRRLRHAAETAEFTTFFGRFRIDPETGKQVGHTPSVVQWQDGEKRAVWPPERRRSEPVYPADGSGGA